MQSTLTPEKLSVDKPVAATAAKLIDQLVDRAKSDRSGAYWPLAAAYRQLPAAQVETTLGAGTAGIVLALAEYYRVTADTTIRELLGRAMAWLEGREQARGFAPGFYFGSGGWWYLQAELQTVLPGLPASREKRRQIPGLKNEADTAGASPASLASGTAGTLVGALAAGGAGRDFSFWRPMVDALGSQARLSPAGLYWDFYPHAVRAPGGFLSGSAGVDYAFAGLQRLWQCGHPQLVAGSVRHADAAFDVRTDNWPDYEGTEMFRQLGETGIARVVQRAAGGRTAEAFVAGDSLGWGAGAAGILLSRAAVAGSFHPHPLTEACLADCRRAIARLTRAAAGEWAGLDPFLQNGLAGIALAVKAYEASGAAAGLRFPPGMGPGLRAGLEEKSARAGAEDLSLLNGLAGLAYTWLKLGSSAPEDSCVNPLARAPVDRRECPSAPEDLPGLFQRRLPRTAAIVALETERAGPEISLTGIERATAAGRSAHGGNLAVEAASYELAMHRQLAEIPSFRHHLFREIYKRMKFAQCYAEGMDEALLLERFRLDEDVALLDLAFDPAEPGPGLRAQSTRLLRYQGSHGIQDFKLSMMQLALLERFQTPAVVIEVISEVIERIQTPTATQRQLAELALKHVRSLVAAGYLFPAPPGRIGALLIRRRNRRKKMYLYPAGISQ